VVRSFARVSECKGAVLGLLDLELGGEGGVSGAEPHSRCREARSLPVVQVSVTTSIDGASQQMVVMIELPM
jgi:hypothetical protein